MAEVGRLEVFCFEEGYVWGLLRAGLIWFLGPQFSEFVAVEVHEFMEGLKIIFSLFQSSNHSRDNFFA